MGRHLDAWVNRLLPLARSTAGLKAQGAGLSTLALWGARFLGLGILVLAALSVEPAGASPGTTERVSVDSLGNQGNGFLVGVVPSISSNGRLVAFSSGSADLAEGDTNGSIDIFVHDSETGHTERVSLDSAGNEANGTSYEAAISGNGRFVVFSSMASNLVPGDTNASNDIFVYDRQIGSTSRVSVDAAGGEANGHSCKRAIWAGCASLNADGRFVAFVSDATNLVDGDTNGVTDVFVHDRDADEDGVFDEPGGISTVRVNVDNAGSQANGGDQCSSNAIIDCRVAISADGSIVAFGSIASNLVPGDTNGVRDVFVHEVETGLTERISVDNAGSQGNGSSQLPSISTDGRFVAFSSDSSNLVPEDTNLSADIFVHDRQTGAIERVSVDSAGQQANGSSFDSAISADGRFVAFVSSASNLVAGDANGVPDVFLHDRLTGKTVRVSIASDGTEGNDRSEVPSISADARFIAFHSYGNTLVTDDTNGSPDAFVHDSGDADGDGEWDPFDPCPANRDCDGDGFTDGVELYVGTDPFLACGTGGWPPDFNDDGRVNLTDVFLFRPHFATIQGDPDYDPRFDLNGDGRINLADVFILRQHFATECVA